MKNIARRILTAALSLTLAVTALTVPVKADDTATANDQLIASDDTQDSSVEEADTDYYFDFSYKTYKKTYTDENGNTYKILTYKYPVFTGSNTSAVNKINAYYTSLRKAWIKNATANLKTAQKEVASGLKDGSLVKGQCFSDTVVCKLTYLDRYYVSVLQDGDEYTLGAHGNPYRVTHVFDLKTGKEVTAKKLLGLTTNKAVDAKVRTHFLNKYKKLAKTGDNDIFLDTTASAFKKTLSGCEYHDNFYLNKNGKVIFYADVYDIAPYAVGYVTVATSTVVD